MDKLSQLEMVLRDFDGPTIAVSGGVDSTTLAEFARQQDPQTRMVHAISPAVPVAATRRVQALAAERDWRISFVDAGEFTDERYLSNPVNRCFYCKSNLYRTLGQLTEGVICSGANTDDLTDYRPGLVAAEENGVRHPYIEAGLAKSDVRTLAAELGLTELSALPASPCLSSRIETGIRVEPGTLRLIEDVETWLQEQIAPQTVRCRIRRGGIEIELDPGTLGQLDAAEQETLVNRLRSVDASLAGQSIHLSAYRRGSAFIGEKAPRS